MKEELSKETFPIIWDEQDQSEEARSFCDVFSVWFDLSQISPMVGSAKLKKLKLNFLLFVILAIS